MICSIILYYTLVLTNGITDGHVKYMPKQMLSDTLKTFKNKELLHEYGISSVVDVRVEEVREFDCSKGPINWVK